MKTGFILKSPAGRIALLCLAATSANIIFSRLSGYLRLGLYLNMVFTVAAAFAGGLMPGLITVVLSTIAYGFGYTYWGSGFSVFAAPP